MRIGITVGDVRGPASSDELVGQVRAASSAGLSQVWMAQAFGWDALVGMAVAGTHVPGVGLGTAVVPTPQRHPLVLAGQALSTQAATGNRLTLGIGAGVASMVGPLFGLPNDRPARRMREYLTVLRPLLRGEQVAHRSETLTAVGAVHLPGAAAPPVLLAALSPAMLRVAGELADGVVTWMTGPKTLATRIVPAVTAAASASGRPAPRLVAGVLVCVTDHGTDHETGVRRRLARNFEIAGRVPEYRAVLDHEGATGPADVAVVGDEEAVAHALRRYAEAGVTDLMAAPYGSPAEQARTVAALADLAAQPAAATWQELSEP
jgi:F420-dependent oxidoreductase-like protein